MTPEVRELRAALRRAVSALNYAATKVEPRYFAYEAGVGSAALAKCYAKKAKTKAKKKG